MHKPTPVEADVLDELRQLRDLLNAGEIVTLRHSDHGERAERLDRLAAHLCSAAVSAAHEAAGLRR